MSTAVAENEVASAFDIAKSGGGILTFFIDSQIYGIEIQYITDIIENQPTTLIPMIPSYIEGVINLRGKVIPVINVRDRFGKEKIEYDERTCIIVIEIEEIAVGLIIDRVSEVINATADQITAPPDNKSINSNRFIKNIVKEDDDIKLILDCHKLILE